MLFGRHKGDITSLFSAFADSSDQLSGLNSIPSFFELFARGGASVYDGDIGLCKVRVCHGISPFS